MKEKENCVPCVDLKDAPSFLRSVEADEDQIIKTLMEANRRIATRKIAANLHDLIKLFFFIHKKKKNSLSLSCRKQNHFPSNPRLFLLLAISNLCDVRIFKTRDS